MARNAHDVFTERAMLAAMMTTPGPVTAAFLSVPVEAYYLHRHQAIAGIIRELLIHRSPVDATTVHAAILDQGLASKIHAVELFEIVEHGGSLTGPGSSPAYAERLCELYARRRMAEEFQREVQKLDAQWESGESAPVAPTIERVRIMLEDMARLAAPAAEWSPPTLADLLAGSTEYDWIVPGLLERMDRVMLTGDEGFGKTELVAQMLCCIAAGIHPFTTEEIQGAGELRVTVMDCENSPSQSRRRYRRMVALVDSMRAQNGLPPTSWDKRLFIDFAPGGLDLLNGADMIRLERYVSATAPDVLAIGPLYKLHRADMNNEEAARQLVSQLDQLRERYGVAIITEAHAGNSKDSEGNRFMRPRGSSLFLGWPEFGLGLRRDRDDPDRTAQVVSWRGHRDERSWPKDLTKTHGQGILPWSMGPVSLQEHYDMPSHWDPVGEEG
jgi:hypothetical protein